MSARCGTLNRRWMPCNRSASSSKVSLMFSLTALKSSGTGGDKQALRSFEIFLFSP